MCQDRINSDFEVPIVIQYGMISTAHNEGEDMMLLGVTTEGRDMMVRKGLLSFFFLSSSAMT